jgi:hypothetical protein
MLDIIFNKKTKIIYFIPLIIFLAFSLFTIFLFSFGPYMYGDNDTDFTILYLYLFFVHISIIIGYFLGCRSKKQITVYNFNYIKTIKLLMFPITALMVLLIYTYRNKLSLTTLSENRDFFNYEFLGTWQSHLSLVLFIFLYPFFSIVTYYWNKITLKIKIFSFFVFLIYGPIGGILGGSRSNVYASLVLIFILFYFLIKTGRMKINKYVFYISFIFSLVVFLYFSTEVINSRLSSTGFQGTYSEYTEELEILNDADATLKINHFFLNNSIPSFIAPALIQGAFYFGHCYYGLYKCIIVEGKSIGFLLSHSAVLNRTIGAYVTENFYNTSYIEFLVRKGEYSYSLWITAYAWIANDLGFILSILFFGFLSYLFSSSWRDSLFGKNVLAFIVFVWTYIAFMSIHVAFITGDYGSLISYYGSVLIYFLYSKKISQSEK